MSAFYVSHISSLISPGFVAKVHIPRPFFTVSHLITHYGSLNYSKRWPLVSFERLRIAAGGKKLIRVVFYLFSGTDDDPNTRDAAEIE